ncbi:MAG TPA: iron ABC transporter permease [Chloroflexota bacterium]|jgi:iron(III) transport system permease protein
MRTAARIPAVPVITLPRPSARWLLLFLLFGVVVFLTAYPTLFMFISSFETNRPGQPVTWGLDAWRTAFADPSLVAALGNTFSLAAIRTLIVTAVAIFFAWVVTRTDTPWKGAIEFTLWLGFFFPQLPMVLGWILLLDPQYGVLNMALMRVFGLSEAPFDVYSYWGIVWAHLAYSTSIRFLLITPAFRAMDAAMEEAARTSGASVPRALWRIVVPLLAPAIVAAVALGFIKGIQSFEVEMVLGIPAGIYVYSTKIWDYIHWEPPLYGPATALSTVFLLMIFALVWVQRLALGRREYTTVTGKSYSVRPFSLGRWRWVTFGICVAWIGVMILLPLAFLLLGTFMRLFGFFDVENVWTIKHWTSAFDDPVLFTSLKNTLLFGLGAAVVGSLFATLVSYVLVRMRFVGRGTLDFLTWLPWALPGVLLGLALLWTFLSTPGLRALYGTIYILILAIVVSELPLGTQVLKASIMQVSKELEESAWMAGASWLYTVRRVVVPLLLPAILAVALIIFIAAVRDIPTVIFLASPQSRTLSLLMLDYIAGAQMERAVVLGVFITFLITVAAILGRLLLGRWLRAA